MSEKIAKRAIEPLTEAQGEYVQLLIDRIAELEAEVERYKADDNLWKHAQDMGYEKANNELKAENAKLRYVYEACEKVIESWFNGNVDGDIDGNMHDMAEAHEAVQEKE